jgi:DNA-binding response OmpR family regulator
MARLDLTAQQHGRLRVPAGTAHLARGEVRYDNGQQCALSAREADLLRYLAANSGRPVSRDEILLHVWRLNPRLTLTRTIDMHIAHLRDKLRDNPKQPRVLLTVHGQGYMLAA